MSINSFHLFGFGMEGSGKQNLWYLTRLEGSGKLNMQYFSCLEGSGRLNVMYYFTCLEVQNDDKFMTFARFGDGRIWEAKSVVFYVFGRF